MADAKDQHEPSMEEILASIRKIISEDEVGTPAPAAGAGAPADDVLVLTDEVDENGAPAQASEPPAFEALPPLADEPPPPDEPKIDLAEPDFDPVPVASEPEPEPMAPPPPSATAPDFGRRLISDTTAAVSLSALSELVSRTHREPNIESLPLGNVNRTLEDLTRELLRPMLKQWLDANLPELVERAVREEIGRLAIDAQRR
jgi:cell pole-organizing protein PopZ